MHTDNNGSMLLHRRSLSRGVVDRGSDAASPSAEFSLARGVDVCRRVPKVNIRSWLTPLLIVSLPVTNNQCLLSLYRCLHLVTVSSYTAYTVSARSVPPLRSFIIALYGCYCRPSAPPATTATRTSSSNRGTNSIVSGSR
jgi:hypothetical protein